MSPLPSIELIGFLNWIDIHRLAYLPVDQTIEELFLNADNREQAHELARQFLIENPPKSYPDSAEGQFEASLDLLLGIIKQECMMKYKSHHWYLYRNPFQVFEGFLSSSEFERIVDNCFSHARNYYDSHHEQATPQTLIDSIRVALEYTEQSPVERYLSELDGSSTNVVKKFIKYLSSHVSIDLKNNNIPTSIIRKYISQYVQSSYFDYRLSEAQMNTLQKTLERAFFNSNSPYLKRITSVQKTAVRYWERTARYKCVFLADGPAFYELVENNWETLNTYSGNYLDIFYNPDELLVKGYQTADKLAIRGLVNQFPCIFLWHTRLSDGKPLPVPNLSCEDILSLIKIITDDIASQRSFDEIVQNALDTVAQMQHISLASADLERNLLENLFRACLQLQANPSMFGDASENQRNTQIRDLLSNLFLSPVFLGTQSYQFSIQDQTLQGLSKSGKSAGEIDLLVKLNHFPYTIIEALNLQSDKNGKHWNRPYLDEHVRRIGNYDQAGLQRNIILIYAKSDNFENFYQSLLNSLESSSSHYRINGSRVTEIQDITEQFPDVCNLRVIRTKYTYNGLDRFLYFFTVNIESLVSASNEITPSKQ